jgi:hypothetical protein
MVERVLDDHKRRAPEERAESKREVGSCTRGNGRRRQMRLREAASLWAPPGCGHASVVGNESQNCAAHVMHAEKEKRGRPSGLPRFCSKWQNSLEDVRTRSGLPAGTGAPSGRQSAGRNG